MRTFSYFRAGAVAGATIGGLFVHLPVARGVVPEYHILDLGTLGGTTSEAHAINDAGQVAGWARDAGGTPRAFLTAANAPINPALDALPALSNGTASFGYAVNNDGKVAGVASTGSGDRGFIASGGLATDLGTLGGDWAYAYGVDAVGRIVGGAAVKPSLMSYPTHAFLYDGVLHDLGTLGGQDSYAQAINSAGLVVGYSQLQPTPTGYSHVHGFVWTPDTANGTSGSMADLGTLGGNYSYAWGINDAGQIVGGSDTTGDLAYHAFLRTTGPSPELIDLGTLGGASSEAYGINHLGMVVGYADTAAAAHAFLHVDGGMHDLNNLIPVSSGWTLTTAKAINASAQIVGWGTSPSGQKHAYLLTPLPTWQVDASGSWSDASNWLGGLPDAPGAQVRFTGAITAPRTVTLDQPRSVGHIAFDSAHAYTLAGPATLTLAGDPEDAAIEVRSGNHLITAPLQFDVRAAVSVAAGGGLQLDGPVHGAVSKLEVGPSATLDLAGNGLVVDYDQSEASPFSAIGALVASAYDGGSWNGPGITSSSAAADSSRSSALGVGEASALGLSSFDGVALDSSAVLIRLTYYGDATLDGRVDVGDLGALATSWQQPGSWTSGDFNYDGIVNVADLGALATNWQKGVGTPLGGSLLDESLWSLGLPYTGVPEPAVLAPLLAMLSIIARRRTQG